MSNQVWGVVEKGRIELLEKADLPEGATVLVTVVPEDRKFWLRAGSQSIDAIWDNAEDDVYESLLST